ncbi:hypothetical protein SAMN04487981_108189 [Streptomyces sp. cf386]|uniref:hypothetical protein n=1 Tax=Streptomyces sp. cf386 TaxID=1761904 RepID=UPI00087E8CE1|nr:hypothetical protein [Streptomyces sp. cf386]SDO08778.1 hypothetical protein SAMN04487981_108189 [Streptomyces sp. cf386]
MIALSNRTIHFLSDKEMFAMRRTATVLLGTLALAGAMAPAANAIPDPVATVTCIAETPAGVTELVDPAALLDPAALVDPAGAPGVSCLAP